MRDRMGYGSESSTSSLTAPCITSCAVGTDGRRSRKFATMTRPQPKNFSIVVLRPSTWNSTCS